MNTKSQYEISSLSVLSVHLEHVLSLHLEQLRKRVRTHLIRRPRPWPRQGRRLGPPQVWNFSFLAFQGHLPALKSHCLNIPLACFILQPTGTARRHINVFFLLMGVQACPLPRPGGPSLPFAMLHPAANRHPKATPHINVFLWASKPAVCQPLNA